MCLGRFAPISSLLVASPTVYFNLFRRFKKKKRQTIKDKGNDLYTTVFLHTQQFTLYGVV